jgi:hypothetical protein
MPETFQTLIKFLERFEEDVEGRARQEPSEDTRLKLQSLARGDLAGSHQTEIFLLLDRNPEWIGWLAREVKDLRPENG